MPLMGRGGDYVQNSYGMGQAGNFVPAGPQFMRDPYKEKEQQIQEQGQKFGQDLAKAKFGLYQQGMSGLQSQLGQVGGSQQQQPQINRNPLYSQQQIDQQTNAGVAGNDARYQTLMRQLGTSAAGRGFGASSPAVQSQLNSLGIANIGENARTMRETPMQYVQANADQNFRTDQLAQQQWQQGEDSDIRRRQTQLQQLNALMSSLGGLV